MAKYVNLDDVIEQLEIQWGYEGLREELYELPDADVAPVRRGNWFWADDGYCRCTECKQKAPIVPQYQDEPVAVLTEFCPHCGTRMYGGKTNGKSEN